MKRKSNFKKYAKSRKELSKMVVQIGAIGKHDDSDLTNAALLRISERGAPTANIPARFSITRGFRQNVPFISKFIQKTIEKNSTKKGYNVDAIGDAVGGMLQGIVKASIMSGLEPALSEKYEERKVAQGFSPLPYVKTGQLLNSISYGVKKK